MSSENLPTQDTFDDEEVISFKKPKKGNTNKKKTTSMEAFIAPVSPDEDRQNDDSRSAILKKLEDKMLLQQARVKSRGVTINTFGDDDSYFGDQTSKAILGSGLSLASALQLGEASDAKTQNATTFRAKNSTTSGDVIQLDNFRKDGSTEDENEQIRAVREAFIAERLEKHRQQELHARLEDLKANTQHDSSSNGVGFSTDKNAKNIAAITTIKHDTSSTNSTQSVDTTETIDSDYLTKIQNPSSDLNIFKLMEQDSTTTTKTKRARELSEIDATEGGERWLTGISEVALPIDVKLRNIERTELARKEALRKQEAMIHEYYMAGKGALTLEAGLTSSEADSVVPANISSNFKRHKREWDVNVRNETYMSSYLREKATAEVAGLPAPMMPHFLQNQNHLRDFSTHDTDKNMEQIRQAAYVKAMDNETQRASARFSSDDKAVKNYIKHNRR